MYYNCDVIADIDDLFADLLNSTRLGKPTQLKVKSLNLSDCPSCREAEENPTAFPAPKQVPYRNPKSEMEYVSQIFTDVNKRMYPFVKAVLDEYEHEGSPIFDEMIDKETLAQIVDKIMELSRQCVENVDETFYDGERYGWSTNRLLRSNVEAHVLMDVYLVRRPRYRAMFGAFNG